MFIQYILLAAAAISAAPAPALNTTWYVPGNFEFVDGVRANVTGWDHRESYFLKAGIDVCPGMSHGEAAIFVNQTITWGTHWTCLNLVTGGFYDQVYENGTKGVPADNCDYSASLYVFYQQCSYFHNTTASSVWSYLMPTFYQGWKEHIKDTDCPIIWF